MISIFKIEFMDGRDRLRFAPADPAMTDFVESKESQLALRREL